MAVVGGEEVEGGADDGQVGWNRAFGETDVLDHDRAGAGAVRFPQLEPVNAIARAEKQRRSHHGHAEDGRGRRWVDAGADVLDKGGKLVRRDFRWRNGKEGE